jgi:multidrug resistance efflux pump
MRSYVQGVAGGGNTADEIERLAQLQAQGAITQEEFTQAKAKLLT